MFAYEALNLAYLALALVGLWRRPPLAGAMLAYMLLRSLLLATIEAPETRYTLECFPMLIALGAMAFTPEEARCLGLRAMIRDRKSNRRSFASLKMTT